MQWPWFALGFALYPVLHIAATNPGETETASVIGASVAVALATLLVLVLLRLWLKNWYRAGLAMT